MSQTLIDTEPFPGVSVRLYGREFGNCNLNPVPSDQKTDDPKRWCQNTIKRLVSIIDGQRLVVLKPQFVPSKVLDFETCQPLRINGQELYRALEPGDAYRLAPQEQVLIALADCLVAVIACQEKVFAVHLGWRGLIPSLEHQQPLLGSIIKHYLGKKDRKKVRVWLGAGADKCCFGYNDGHPIIGDIVRRYPAYPLASHVLCGPRKGQVALSQLAIAKKQLENLGVGQLVVDSRCTSCWGDPPDDKWGEAYSNLRDDSHNGYNRRTYFRNGLVVSWNP